MALSRLWSAFIIIAIVVAGIKTLVQPHGTDMFNRMVVGKAGDTAHTVIIDSAAIPSNISQVLAAKGEYKNGDDKYARKADGSIIHYQEQSANGILATCKDAVELSIGLIGIMALFMGFMSIADKAGGMRLLSRIIGPFFTKLFPDVPRGHPALGHMTLNFSANLLGLDNAATPFGIRTMESLQELNKDKTTASNAQIMFLCLHAAGLTLIPVSIIAARSKLGAANPVDIFVPCMIATFVATLAALLIVSFKQKINIFQPVILSWIGGISALIALIVMYVRTLDKTGVDTFSGLLGNGMILLIFILIVAGGLYKKINLFDAFVEGAKGGFETAVKIIPYLVGMLVAISMLRTSGCFDIVINGIKNLFAAMHVDTGFVDGLPTALVKPFTGSGARGMMISAMTTYGPDSFAGRLSCVLQGSSDTTFYVVAVYYGAVSIKNTRYSIGVMLLADLIGIITSVILAYLFFGG
ncbi:MAG: spore maturation protein [Bacteroidetes bacterium]|nr:spore maturation protein [Bacteroidota bacterium]